MTIRIRLAEAGDIPVLRELIAASVRGLQAGDYSPARLESALRTVYGVDTQLIADGTYFAAEAADDSEAESSSGLWEMEAPNQRLTPAAKAASEEKRVTAAVNRCATQNPRQEPLSPQAASPLLVGCGGWSKRKTLYGGDQWAKREDSLLDPATDAAKIRAFFVHPEWARRGIGGMILEACETAAFAAGFQRLEMGATLTGVPFYRAKGYVELENAAAVPLEDGLSLPIVRMGKKFAG